METTQFTLKSCRVNSGYTLKEIALLMDKSEKTIRNWENGKYIPNSLELAKLAEIYCVPEKLIFLGYTSTLSGHFKNIRTKNVALPIIQSPNL